MVFTRAAKCEWCTACCSCLRVVVQRHGANHDHVLEHSLHQLLREVHYRNNYQPLPHPATAVLGVSKRRRLAGPLGYTREKLHEPPRLSYYFIRGQEFYVYCWSTLTVGVPFSNIPYLSTFVEPTVHYMLTLFTLVCCKFCFLPR